MRHRSCSRTAAAFVGVLLGAVGGGCGDYKLDFGHDEAASGIPHRRRPQFWSMFDIAQALSDGRPVAESASFPRGFPADLFLDPSPDPQSSQSSLRIIPAFSEGEPAAYVVPEIWVDFPIVWAQPWYSFVTAWNDKTTGQNRLRDPVTNAAAPPVFDVHPKSLFYSPFWLVFYVVVKDGTPYDRYTSAEDIFNDGLAIYPGPPWIYSVRPPQVVLPSPAEHPYLKKPVASWLGSGELSWVDNEAMPYFNEGLNNFKYNDKLEIEEVPLFIFLKRDPDGTERDIPNAAAVIGTGPLLARKPADAPLGRPRFGSYTRFHQALVPATAGAFTSAAFPEARAMLEAKKLDPGAYEGRVAVNALQIQMTDRSCFTAADFPMGCRWLDSQGAVEDNVGIANIRRTEVTACSPVVFYAGKAVPR